MKSLDVLRDFPALTQKVNGQDLIYLDTAATSLKPKSVIDRIHQFNSYQTANVHRGAHHLADQATRYYEGAREQVAKFIGAQSASEIVFVRGTTEGINLVASSLGELLATGDEILVSEIEHHANIVPWQMLAKKKNLNIKVIPMTLDGDLDFEAYLKLLSDRVKVVAITHASNHLGTLVDVKKFSQAAKKFDATVVVDGAQRVGKSPVDVQSLGADFYAFSGHKMFAPFGIGALYGRKEILEKLPPYQGGGSMISRVSFLGTTFNDIPYRFEAGTPNVEGVVGLAAAIDYIESVGLEKIDAFENEITKYAYDQLAKIEGLHILGPKGHRAALVSFNIKGIHHSDLGQILDEQGIAVRGGHHCTQPLLEKLKLTGSVRASFSIYNTESDIQKLVAGIKKAKELLL